MNLPRFGRDAYTVHKARYSEPIHLVEGKKTFLAKIEAGDDLRPNQITKLQKLDYRDGMLNDFGIQYFHLGTAQHPTRPSFVARTDPLLLHWCETVTCTVSDFIVLASGEETRCWMLYIKIGLIRSRGILWML